MSTAASQRRDPRRRLGLAWNRSAPAVPKPEPRRPAAYAPEASPERQPSLATLLPASLGGLALAAVALLVALAATTGVGLWEAVTGRPLFDGTGSRFAATLVSARRCLDVRSLESLGGWLAQLCLATAAVTALVVRGMRRHRRDEHRGRSRAWGWLAGLFVLTACAGQAPLGSLFASFVSDATGIAIGPNGIGWWVLAAGACYAVVGIWSVLPLHERAATGIWLSSCLAAWAAAAACGWIGRDLAILSGGRQEVVGNVCWMAGGVLAAIAMFAAARSVLREVRGLPSRTAPVKQASRAEGSPPPLGMAMASPAAVDACGDRHERLDSRGHGADSGGQPHGRTEFVDGGDAADSDDDLERPGRQLSKAERKRLRKLARMSRAA